MQHLTGHNLQTAAAVRLERRAEIQQSHLSHFVRPPALRSAMNISLKNFLFVRSLRPTYIRVSAPSVNP